MYEPHRNHHHNYAQQNGHSDEQGASLLEELDKIAPMASFDAFPKVCHFLDVDSGWRQ